MDDGSNNKLVWPLAGFFVAMAFGVGVIATAAFNSDDPDAVPVAASAAGAAEPIAVELGDLFIEPATIHAAPGSATFEVANDGKVEHNFVIEGVGGTEMIAPGDAASLNVDLEAGKYQVICAVPGHADGGMKATLMVSEDGAEEDEAAPAEEMSAEEMAKHDAAVTAEFPAATKGKGGEVLEPEIAADGTKVFELTASAIEWETEPGTVQEAWAYNGMVPGPQIHADLGDKVRIILNNELVEPTTMHLHGMTVPANMDGVPVISQDAVLPGESFTYEFTVRNTGSNMYHSHFNAQKQVPMGLLGALIVEDPKDPPADVDHTMILNDGPLGYTINGKGFPATEPIVAEEGQMVRIRYMNEGLQIHPMHLHGMPQKVISKDGHLLPKPYMADTVLVGPGERYDVLVRATEVGAWAFHCHVLNHAEGPEGMFGMVTAMIVQ
ncbi:MAG TPA: multicopper oxidase domain-containing protein [Actinomycetota bacterium]|nr:multicopper oxidase domain-containing protein [Actinomycetota bacterium]